MVKYLQSLEVEPVHEGPAGVLPAAPVTDPPPPAATKVVGADDPVDELHVAADHARYLVVQMRAGRNIPVFWDLLRNWVKPAFKVSDVIQ